MKKAIAFALGMICLLLLFQFIAKKDNAYLTNGFTAREIVSAEYALLPNGPVYQLSDEQIKDFVEAFNRAAPFSNEYGTSHPYSVRITCGNASGLTVWGGGNQGFCTMQWDDQEQQNIRGRELNEWFAAYEAFLAKG